VVQVHHCITVAKLITMVQINHPKHHGKITLAKTLYQGFGGGTFVPWYTMVQLITMVQLYHPENHGK
jgi:hypothetical protein